MRALKGAAVVAHGGGPTQVINASLAGVYDACRRHGEITALWGARNGILGVFEEQFHDLYRQDPAVIAAVGRAPGSAIGSCRYKVKPEDHQRILDVFQKHNVRYFFYTGGNDSMDTALKVSKLAQESGYELRVVGVPKTVDNDLPETDHCPGYGSGARFFACAVRDIANDLRSLPRRVTFVEAMGRNAGWLVAAAALARRRPDDPPQIIYCPERPLTADKLLADVETVYRRDGYAVIAVSEAQKDDKGEPFGADQAIADAFGWRVIGNLSHNLANLVVNRLRLRARSEKPGLLGRSCAAHVSEVDRQESYRCGQAAVEAAIAGTTGQMVTLVREPGVEYRCATGLAELEKVANAERLLPPEWINASGTDVLPGFVQYAAPLVGPIEPIPRLA
jgi:6-phosphofructokinase 1